MQRADLLTTADGAAAKRRPASGHVRGARRRGVAGWLARAERRGGRHGRAPARAPRRTAPGPGPGGGWARPRVPFRAHRRHARPAERSGLAHPPGRARRRRSRRPRFRTCRWGGATVRPGAAVQVPASARVHSTGRARGSWHGRERVTAPPGAGVHGSRHPGRKATAARKGAGVRGSCYRRAQGPGRARVVAPP